MPEAEYVVFEHGPYDYEQEHRSVAERIEHAMKHFDYEANGNCLDTTPGRILYFHFDPSRFWKYVRSVHKLKTETA